MELLLENKKLRVFKWLIDDNRADLEFGVLYQKDNENKPTVVSIYSGTIVDALINYYKKVLETKSYIQKEIIQNRDLIEALKTVFLKTQKSDESLLNLLSSKIQWPLDHSNKRYYGVSNRSTAILK